MLPEFCHTTHKVRGIQEVTPSHILRAVLHPVLVLVPAPLHLATVVPDLGAYHKAGKLGVELTVVNSE